MKNKETDKIKALEEEISILTAENESMAERAEEIYLLAMVSESISEINEVNVLIETVLEKMSILKDIPLCCFCSVNKTHFKIKIAYASFADIYSNQEFIGNKVIMEELEEGIIQAKRSQKKYLKLFNSIDTPDFKPGSLLIVPRRSIANELLIFVFADDDEDTTRLIKMITMILETINILNGKLDNIYLLQELKKINLDLERKISERTSEIWEANRLLRNEIENNRKTEEAYKIKNEELNNFVYRVSHDLRAPITSVEGLINIIKLESKGKVADLNPYIELLDDRVKNLDRFIRDILSHSRNIRTSANIEKIQFKKIINECFNELTYLENAGKMKRKVSVSEGAFYNDRIRIFEIFRNLISNAIKYSDTAKKTNNVIISVVTHPDKALINIQDNGIGISKESITKIFEMFYRGHESSKGSGIGLYIVKQAINKLGGDIHVESVEESGTHFTIEIPNKLQMK